jgi:hypothetical protein
VRKLSLGPAGRLPAVAPAIILLLLGTATPARAVIKLDVTPAKIYQTSRAVVVGSVASVDSDLRLVTVKVTETMKGDAPGEQVRVQVVGPADLLKQVAVEQPIALFRSNARGMAVLHLADTWLLAQEVPGASPQTWRTIQVHEPTRQAFPGRTAALVRLLSSIKAGKNPILDRLDQNFFQGGVRKVAKLAIERPQWMLAADFNSDGKPDLVLGAAKGPRLFLSSDDGLADATKAWGLSAASAECHAVGDANGDGKPDLLLGNTLWINNGKKFVALTPPIELPETNPLAAALVPLSSSKKADALLFSAGGDMRILKNPGSADGSWTVLPAKQLWKDESSPRVALVGEWGDDGKPHVMVVRAAGITRYALDASGGPAADFLRLTGTPLAKQERFRDGLNNARGVALDVNGDHLPDLLIVCDGGALLLVNRGFGTFLLDPDAGVGLSSAEVSSSAILAAADLHGAGADDLLVLDHDGTLRAVGTRSKKAPHGP